MLITLQDALTQLRSMSSSGIGHMSEPIETLQSRARELEKKVCLINHNNYNNDTNNNHAFYKIIH